MRPAHQDARTPPQRARPRRGFASRLTPGDASRCIRFFERLGQLLQLAALPLVALALATLRLPLHGPCFHVPIQALRKKGCTSQGLSRGKACGFRLSPGQSLERLMGSGLDAAKTVSSLTLFEAAGLDSAGALLDQIGRRCERTLERLS